MGCLFSLAVRSSSPLEKPTTVNVYARTKRPRAGPIITRLRERKQYLRGVMRDFRYALFSGLRADLPRAYRSFHEKYKGRIAGSMSLGMTDCYSRLRGY